MRVRIRKRKIGRCYFADLKDGGQALRQRIKMAFRTWKGKERYSSLEPLEGMQPCISEGTTPDFSSVRPIFDF